MGGPLFSVGESLRRARSLARGRALTAALALGAAAAGLTLVSAFTSNYSPLSVELEGAAAPLAAAKVCGVASGGEVFELPRAGAGWRLERGAYPRKLLLVLPKAGLHGVSLVRVVVGRELFEFRPRDFGRLSIMRLGRVENREWDVFELPEDVRGPRSLFPNFSPVNWRGDLYFCAAAVFWWAVYLALLLVPWYIFFSGRKPEAGKAAPAAAAAAKPGPPRGWDRELSLGRGAHLALVFLLTSSVVGAISLLQVDPHHDGAMLKPAADVARGMTLFRDTFTQYGAMSTWLQALAIKAAGEYLLTIRLLTALCHGLIASLLWLACARFLPPYLATFSCLAWLGTGYFFLNYMAMFVMPWSTVYAVCAVLLTLHFMLKYAEGGGRRWLSAAGAAAALAAWFKINYGAAAFLSAAACLALLPGGGARGKAAASARFLAGWLPVHALVAGWLALQGSFRDFTLQSVKFALTFSGNNLYSAPAPLPVRVAKSLLQLDSPHGGMSFLWLVLPLAACAALFLSARACRAPGGGESRDRSALATALFALGLWLGYYPIPALFHMYMSSPLFFGLLSLLALKAAERWGFSRRRLLVLAVPLLLLLPDLAYRARAFTAKLYRAGSWERLESPRFLRGMYVPPHEKRTYEALDKLISGTPGPLLNLTNSALFSLYRPGEPNVHKLSMDWDWNNSYLYPDYIPAVRARIAAGGGCIVANHPYLVPGYVPARSFPTLQATASLSRPVVLLLPGRRAEGFRLLSADTVRRAGGRDGFPEAYRFRLLALPGARTVDSVVLRLASGDTLKAEIPRYEFEYGLLERAADEGGRRDIASAYELDGARGVYFARPMDAAGRLRLFDAVAGEYLYDKGAAFWDTFVGSLNTEIYVSRNGRRVDYGELTTGIACRPGDVFELQAPVGAAQAAYAARLRVNFGGGLYQEIALRKGGG